MRPVSESTVEAAALDWLACLGWTLARGHDNLRRVTKIEFPGDGGLRIEASSTVTGTVNCTRDGVGNLLRKHGYPPDKQEKATRTVLEQAEALSAGWAA